ncbi:hypothetical protein P171DRAFT_366687 [Karstenula rhodostoma CBS 690.94]|uniref:Cation chloride cotransporter n=1 Tax=Karstenula rhodostoma CBS 690.94 TaxID=1392251 RepID=A0A9P4U7C4_9PLEO|nr:hypothetical protein P171DRAFT_366687 [Karstenula rhodostoma CBS 690.94]
MTEDARTRRRMPLRSHSSFAARTATDDAERLNRRGSILPTPTPSPGEETPLLARDAGTSTVPAYDGPTETPQERDHALESMRDWFSPPLRLLRSKPPKGGSKVPKGKQHAGNDAVKPRPGAFPRPVGGTSKLGTFAGVFVPTTLNVLSILMFLRFGFILGQAGVVGMLVGMLVACYAINLLTTMSISAIATNGTVRGGGAYYLISRSLGPEFGGSIGIVFYLGLVFNTSMNAVGLIDCFIENFGVESGSWSPILLEGFKWQFLWATIVLLICTLVCLAGSGLFARCSNGLLFLLIASIISIPLSALILDPFSDAREGVEFTGLSLQTLRGNLLPHFTKGASGSQDKRHHENWSNLFGILFPACSGIFAGASMSGDLERPSTAIPKGTLYGLGLTFVSYTVVILAMAASITRESFINNTNVIQLTNISGAVILLGEFATSSFSVLMGVIGSAKLLQALARDHLLPGLSVFGQGTANSDDPTYAIMITYLLAQLTMLSDINQIASFVTMTYLMTFLVTNLATFALKIGSAPNFRPSFHFFNWQTAAIGAIVSGATMFFVDGVYASGCVALLIVVFLLIHYTTPPKPWGDVSQSLIYHQVRKYLLRLRQEHVKFWRPQILLLVNDPRRQYKLIQFCNSLKKGGLFVLGHVIISTDFGVAVPEARRQQQSWTKYIDFSKIKAFVNITISPMVEWGARNLVLSAGLGGMRPNVVVMGFYNLSELRQSKPLIDIPSPQPSRPVIKATSHPLSRQAIQAFARRKQPPDKLSGILPTDEMKPENAIGIQSYVTVVEDLVLRLQINVALAKGFHELEVPIPKPMKGQQLLSRLRLADPEENEPTKKYIDLWPIQMSAEIATAGEDPSRKNVLTTNFDTYTLILQLGCILHTVPSWKRTYKLRVAVFVEYETDVEEERGRVITLLRNLRIEAEVLVFWLASGSLKMYEIIVNGKNNSKFSEAAQDVNGTLEDEDWWADVQRLRNPHDITASQELVQASNLLEAVVNWPTSSFQHGRRGSKPKRFAELKRLLRRTKRKTSASDLGITGATIGMRAQRLPAELPPDSDSEGSSSSDGEFDEYHEEAVDTGSSVGMDKGFDEYDLDASDSDDEARPSGLLQRARTTTAARGLPFITTKFGIRKNLWKASSQEERPTADSVTPLKPHPEATTSDTALLTTGKAGESSSSTQAASQETQSAPVRPPPIRHQSLPKFTSNPTPRTAVASEETAGPSIMFVDTPSSSPSTTRKKDPIASAVASSHLPSPSSPTAPLPSTAPAPAPQASGYPLHQSIPLSFNDLPCRAQHLVLNELIRQHSDDTAVVFTTLPSPVEGTSESEAESVKYISDLEVLCQGLPPCLLVHSNSMTVTMNL